MSPRSEQGLEGLLKEATLQVKMGVLVLYLCTRMVP